MSKKERKNKNEQKSKKRIICILLIILSIITIAGICINKLNKKSEITKEEVTYTVFLQMVDENKINSIEIEENSSIISGFSKENPNHIYTTKVSSRDILDYNDSDITVNVKERSILSVVSSLLISYILLSIIFLFPAFLVFDIFKFFYKCLKKKQKSRMNPQVSENEKRLIAVHEAGHAVVSLFLYTLANNIEKVSIISQGSTGGYTIIEAAEDINYITKKELRERLICLMGGRAAESVVLGDISIGASKDLKEATETAYKMVTYYGMDKDIGPISFAGIYDTNLDFLSGETLGNIGSKVSEMLKEAENEATKLITEHRLLLDELVKKLLEQETVSGEEIKAMYKTYIK